MDGIQAKAKSNRRNRQHKYEGPQCSEMSMVDVSIISKYIGGIGFLNLLF